MTDITERGGNASSGSGTGKFSGGFNLNNCWFHGTNGHDILECETFKRLSNVAKFEQIIEVRCLFSVPQKC